MKPCKNNSKMPTIWLKLLRRKSNNRKRKKKLQNKWSVSINILIKDEITEKRPRWENHDYCKPQKWTFGQNSIDEIALKENCI